MTLDHLSTHERFVLRPDARGHLGKPQLRGVSNFLRCHHTGARHAMAPRVLHILYAVAQHFNAPRVEIVAGYRAPSVARQKGNPRSHHKQGRACDFRIEGVALTALRDYVKQTFDQVGVGYYPNSGFLHVDVARKRRVYWVDTSGPGQAMASPAPSAVMAATVPDAE